MPGMQSIEGLASNLNISDIIDKIISYKRVPAAYMEREKAFKMQQSAAYNTVLAKFIALKSQATLLGKEIAFDKVNLSVSDDSVLTATASGKPAGGLYNVRVTSLAANHQIASQGFTDALANDFGTGTIRIAVGQAGYKTIDIDDGNNNLVAIKDAINDAGVGVTASIINDGTASQPYRLLLTADRTGAANTIDVEVSLDGGGALDFTGGHFDSPEEISFASGTSSRVSLGETAQYSGTTNKVYTFTVAGDGAQTVGTDSIVLNWTDGTHSGSITVDAAEAEYELTGDGAEGLKLTFSAGDLTAGDTFQVSTFSPLLQKAADAAISVGGDGSGEGSPIVVRSATNVFDEVIPGVTLNVSKTTEPGQVITIESKIDTSGIKAMITELVNKYNEVMDFIDEQFTYNQDTTESGVLFADYSLQIMQSTVRSTATSVIEGLESDLNSLASLGIRTGQNGKLKIASAARLTDLIDNNLEALTDLFVDRGKSSSPYLEYIFMTDKTAGDGEFLVDITRVASRGYFQGGNIIDPAAEGITIDSGNNTLKFIVDGIVSDDLVLTEKTYHSGEELAAEIRSLIDNDEALSGRGLDVSWVDLGDEGYLRITSGTYGSKSRVELVTSIASSGFATLGLAAGTVHVGDDVEGTINGEKATGSGQVLIGADGNATSEGLRLLVKYDRRGLLSDGPEATLTVSRGVASRLNDALENITKSVDGTIARRTSALENQIEALDRQITDFDARLERRREELYKQFLAMEEALSQYQSEGSYLESQLASLSSNWAFSLRGKD